MTHAIYVTLLAAILYLWRHEHQASQRAIRELQRERAALTSALSYESKLRRDANDARPKWHEDSYRAGYDQAVLDQTEMLDRQLDRALGGGA